MNISEKIKSMLTNDNVLAIIIDGDHVIDLTKRVDLFSDELGEDFTLEEDRIIVIEFFPPLDLPMQGGVADLPALLESLDETEAEGNDIDVIIK